MYRYMHVLIYLFILCCIVQMNKTEFKISAVNEVKVGAAKVMLALDLHKFSFPGTCSDDTM